MSFIPFLILGLIAAVDRQGDPQAEARLDRHDSARPRRSRSRRLDRRQLVTGEDIYGVNGSSRSTSWLFAIGGAVIVLLVFGLITRGRSSKS